MATVTTPHSRASMLLLAPELLAITLYAGSARNELGPFDTMTEPVLDNLHGTTRASVAA